MRASGITYRVVLIEFNSIRLLSYLGLWLEFLDEVKSVEERMQRRLQPPKVQRHNTAQSTAESVAFKR